MPKVVLVTGANKGIGFEVARQLGRADSVVLLGARDASRGEAAAAQLRSDGLDVRYVPVDLTKALASATTLAEQVRQEFGRPDVLVNNAGVWDSENGPASNVSLEVLRRTFEANFFGVVAFTQPLVPLLRAAEAARIVNVSSGLGSLAINSDPTSALLPRKAACL